MLSHNQAKHITSLKIKKYRQLNKAFIVEGEKGVSELIASSLVTQKVYACAEWIEKYGFQALQKHIEVQEITEAELKKVSDLATPNQVLAIAAIPEINLPEPTKFEGMALSLDGIRDPGNLGTIIRTADWFGIRQIICSPDSVDMYNAKVIQATMGSFSRVSVFYTGLVGFLSQLPADFPIYGALLDAPDITQRTFCKPGIILIGSESHGLSPELSQMVNEPVYIPRFSGVTDGNIAESLNASIANGIICYEICKQLFKNNF
jgi:TrmH family RNA methyltransferase